MPSSRTPDPESDRPEAAAIVSRRSVVALGPLFAVAPLSLFASACGDSSKVAAKYAADVVQELAPTLPKDFANVRSGLVDGAKTLATLLPTDESSELKRTRDAIGTTRERTDAIRNAPTSFFIFVNTKGIVVRSEHDPDELAEKDLFAVFPALKKSVEGAGEAAEAFGEMTEMRRVKRGDELEWIAAVPVLDKDGKPRGAFCGGWTLRWYATYLQNQGKRFVDTVVAKTKQKEPVMYVYIVKGGKAYGAQETPDANAEAVAKLDVASKAKGGLYQDKLQITGVSFAIAAVPAPDFGDDAALAVVASVF